MNIGIVGAGFAASLHSDAIRMKFPTINQYVYDVNIDVAEKFAEKHQAFLTNNYSELLKCTDAIIISTPSSTHFSLAIEAINNKKHILCEKPMALNIGEAIEMTKAASNNNIIAAIGFNYRYFEITRLLKNESPVGDIRRIKLAIDRLNRNEWHNKNNGVLSDLGVHLIDLIMFVCNQKFDLNTCRTHIRKKEDWDYDACVCGKMNNGIEFILSASRIDIPSEVKFLVEIEGENGVLSYDSREMRSYTIERKGAIFKYSLMPNYEKDDFFDFFDSIMQQDLEWIKMINTNTYNHLALFIDGVSAQQALDFFYSSKGGALV